MESFLRTSVRKGGKRNRFQISSRERIWQSHILIISSILHCPSLSRGSRQRLSPLAVDISTDV